MEKPELYRDELAEKLVTAQKDSRKEMLESAKETGEYQQAYELHKGEVKEYAIARIDEKVAELKAEIVRLDSMRDFYTKPSEPGDATSEVPATALDVERELIEIPQKCVLETLATGEEIQEVLACRSLVAFREHLRQLIEHLLKENGLNKLEFIKRLKPDSESAQHEIMRTVLSRIVSGDRPISIGSFQHRHIFKGLGLDISDFASKIESLQTKAKLDFDIVENFFKPERVVLNEFAGSLDKMDRVDFSSLISSLHQLDNEGMNLPEIEGSILKFKPTERQVLEVLAADTLGEFNERLSVFISGLLDANNLSPKEFAEEIGIDPSIIRNVRNGSRPISSGAEQHKKLFLGLGLDIRLFESRQRKLINDVKFGEQKLEDFKYSDRDIKPYLQLVAEHFSDVTVGDLVRIAHFIDDTFEMIDKNSNVFVEILSNEFPDLKRTNKQ